MTFQVRRRTSAPGTTGRALSALALFVFAALALVAPPLVAQGQSSIPGMQASGPRIMSGGFTIKVDDPSFVVPADHTFRAVFEIREGDGDGADVNPQLTTVARFLNLHARHGVPDDQVMAAAVVHGPGFAALLTDEAYAARFDGKTNPTRELVEELLAEGVQLVLCGQTAGGRGVTQDELLPGAQIALSAMTALNYFLSQGYHLNPW